MTEDMIIAVARLWLSNEDYSAYDIAKELDLDKAAVSRICDMLLHLMSQVVKPIVQERVHKCLDDVL